MKKIAKILVLSCFIFVSIFANEKTSKTCNREKIKPLFHKNQESVQLPKPAFSSILFESFEDSFPPQGWLTISDGDSDEEWIQLEGYGHSGNNSAVVFYCDTTETMDEWLITPPIDLSQAQAPFLQFYEMENYWEDGIHHYIKISTSSQSDQSTFQTLMDMTPDNHQINGFNGDPVLIDLSNYIGQDSVYIAFQYVGTYADTWVVDDVEVLQADEHDVSVVEMVLSSEYESGMTIEPKVALANVGLNQESFSVNFGYYDWDENPVIIDTKNVENLSVGDTAEVTFNYTLNPDFQAIFFTETVLESDQDSSNNCASIICNSFSKTKMQVLIEKGTATWCGFCPGSAMAIDSLMQNYSQNIAVIEYHGDDDFETSNSTSRLSFYEITGFPTAIFNGLNWVVGGSSATNWKDLYSNFSNGYDISSVQKTGFSMTMEVHDHGGSLTAVSQVTYEAVSLLKSYRIFYALTESHIAKSWIDLDSLQYVFRDMFPNVNGKLLYTGTEPPTAGLIITDSVQFSISDDFVQENCQLVAFLQDVNSKEIMSFAKVDLEPRESETPIHCSEKFIQPPVLNLSQNYPNPFNPDTWILFELAKSGYVEVNIYNINGRLIRNLVSSSLQPGQHKIHWDGNDNFGRETSSGIYFLKVIKDKTIKRVKMLKLK